MKTKDKIILYLDDQVEGSEKAEFEKQLSSSSELQSELQKQKQLLSEMKSVKDVSLNSDYFVNLIPEVRGRLSEKKRYQLFPKLTLGVSTALAIMVVAFFVYTGNNMRSVNNISNTTNTAPNSQISSSYTQNILTSTTDQYGISGLTSSEAASYDSVLSNMIASELSASPQGINNIIADNNGEDYTNMLKNLNTKETEEIYNELKSTRFFKR
jgi:hypothetical protein